MISTDPAGSFRSHSTFLSSVYGASCIPATWAGMVPDSTKSVSPKRASARTDHAINAWPLTEVKVTRANAIITIIPVPQLSACPTSILPCAARTHMILGMSLVLKPQAIMTIALRIPVLPRLLSYLEKANSLPQDPQNLHFSHLALTHPLSSTSNKAPP